MSMLEIVSDKLKIGVIATILRRELGPVNTTTNERGTSHDCPV